MTDQKEPFPLIIVGLDCARSPGHLSLEQLNLLRAADVICAGKPLLREFFPYSSWDAQPGQRPDAGLGDIAPHAQLFPLTFPLDSLLGRLEHLRRAGKRVVLLANGDPLLFGIGASVVRQLGPQAVHLVPAVSALQQACARLALPWHKVRCLSLHGRDDLYPLYAASGKNLPLCILTDERMSPAVLARRLLERGVDWFEAHIFERMGTEDERQRHLSLVETAESAFGPACTVMLLPTALARQPCLGLENTQLLSEGGCISSQSVRAVALSLLRIAPQHVVWDIGSGSGAVALEAAALAHEGRVIAIERSTERVRNIEENRRRYGAALVDVYCGQAPECLSCLPQPDRVFIGGGLSRAGESLLGHACQCLPVGGRLVASCVLLESLCLCRSFFEMLAWPIEIIQIAAAEGKNLGKHVHLVGMNPVFLLAAQKPVAAKQSGLVGTT